MSQTPALQALLERKRLERQEFPLASLLRFYLASPRLLYIERFSALRLLVQWLGPISKSKYAPIELPTCFLTYECQEIGVILGEHPTVIYQELYSLWKPSI